MLDRIADWSGAADVRLLESPPGGYSNELVFVEIDGEARVLRLVPSGPPLFPGYDLDMQVAVQGRAAAAGVPVPSPVVAEHDPSWLGRPFLAMPRIDGRHPGEAPMLTPWIQDLAPEEQRRLQGGFLGAVAAVHRADPSGLGLRPWSEELGYWDLFAAWACEGRVAPDVLLDLVAACRASAPASFAPSTLLWGDVRMGNTVVADDLSVAAVLDWEMASEGPAESDLAWLTALHALTLSFVGDDLPGFRPRDEVIAHHEAALGRPMQDMDWHEAFAITRAACLQFRVDVVTSLVKGQPTPDPAAHVMVGAARAAVDALLSRIGGVDRELRAAYLTRLGVEAEPPSVDALVRLHRAQVEQVPYETLWIHLGEGWRLDTADAVVRVATRQRGGYCFHLNGAFSELLSDLGYDVVRHVGGVHGPAGPDEAVMANHLVLTVRGLPTDEDEDGTWYVDAGLGDALHEPVPLRAAAFDQGPFHLELVETPGDVGDWHLDHDPAGSFRGMAWRAAPVGMDAFAAKHEWLSTSPDSGFVRVLTAQRRDATGVDILRGLVVQRVGAGATSRDIETPAELAAALGDLFGLTVPPEALPALWARTEATHEAWVAAGRP